MTPPSRWRLRISARWSFYLSRCATAAKFCAVKYRSLPACNWRAGRKLMGCGYVTLNRGVLGQECGHCSLVSVRFPGLKFQTHTSKVPLTSGKTSLAPTRHRSPPPIPPLHPMHPNNLPFNPPPLFSRRNCFLLLRCVPQASLFKMQTHFHLLYKQTAERHLLRPLSNAAFVNNKMPV